MIVIVLFIVATLVFIWGNSLESVALSSDKSRWVLKYMVSDLEPVFGKKTVTDHLIRKLAHLMEFGLLGVWLALFMIMRRHVRLQAIANCLFFGLSAAVLDEALQHLSGRGSQVSDVLLDFAGAAGGMLVVIAVRWGVLRIRKNNPYIWRYL